MHEFKLSPPLRLWKLLLMLTATVSVYQFAWLYRTTSDIRNARNPSFAPWHWVFVPLLGPFAAVPIFNLAVVIDRWREDSSAEQGHFAEPLLVAMLVAVAYLPLALVAIEPTALWSALLVTALLLCIPFLALQNQLNLIESKLPDESGSRAYTRFTKAQLVTAIVGGLVATPLYLLGFTEIWETRSAAAVQVQQLVEADDSSFRVRVNGDGWSRVEPGYIVEDSDMEFIGPDDWTWAIIYDSSGSTVDEILSHRIHSIRSNYRKAKCKQTKTLQSDDLIVRGHLECSGRHALDGSYYYASRVLADGTRAIEMLAATTQRSEQVFGTRRDQVGGFIDGLELITTD